MDDKYTLNNGEPHPAVSSALAYIKTLSLADLLMWQSAFASCAIEGNRLAEICLGTLNRYLNGEPISDRYLLGLVWAMRDEK